MNTSSIVSASPGSDAPASPSPRREWLRELKFLIIAYVVTVFVASSFIAACGPGCCYVFYSIIAGISGVLMLRRAFSSRCICLGVLLLSLFGMWHEKEVRDTWGQRVLRLQIQKLQQKLDNTQSTPPNTPLEPAATAPSVSTNK
jgi:hypothetical protein